MTNLDLNAPSSWAPGLTHREAIRLADLRELNGINGLSWRFDREDMARLEAKLAEGWHGVALEENAHYDAIGGAGMVWLP